MFKYMLNKAVKDIINFKIKPYFDVSSDVRRNFLVLMTGTTLAQIIPFLLSPVLARIFTTQDFGTFSQFASITGLIGIVVTGRYELAIVLPRKNSDALNIFFLSILISTIVSIFTFVLIIIFNTRLTLLLKNPDLSFWLYFAPLSIFFIGVFQCLNYWFNRTQSYKLLSLNKITRNVGVAFSNVAIGFSKLSSGGLILGQIIGDGIATIIFGFFFLKNNKITEGGVCVKTMREQAVLYREFPLINSFQAFIDQIRESGIIFIISIFFSSSILGLYSFGYRVISVPITLVCFSASQIFYQNTSSQYSNSKPIFPFLISLIKKLSAVSVLFLIFIFLFIERIFVGIFGDSWHDAGTYIRILSPYLAMSFIVSPISTLPLILRLQKPNFLISTLYNSLALLSLLTGSFLTKSIHSTLILFSITSSFGLLAILLWFFSIAKKYDKKLLNHAH